MFSLKTIERKVDCAREEFEYRRTRKRGERKSRLSCMNSLPGCSATTILSTASANLKAMGGIALAAYRQLWKPMFQEVMKEVCHEGTYGFYRKPN
jgi:hypothetical protein